MKVVLKETVFDRIVERIRQARRDNRKVDYIVVSETEYRELRDDARLYSALSNCLKFAAPGEVQRDATFRTWEFRLRPQRNHRPPLPPYIRVASFEEFMGYPLVAVPDDYMPD